MPENAGFAFDLEGPLELYGCGHCGSQDIEAYGAGDVLCRKCYEITTSERWQEWCEAQGIDIMLGPFLQAVKDVKRSRGLPFDPVAARSRYLGEGKAHVRKTALAGNRELRERYRVLTVRVSGLLRL